MLLRSWHYVVLFSLIIFNVQAQKIPSFKLYAPKNSYFLAMEFLGDDLVHFAYGNNDKTTDVLTTDGNIRSSEMILKKEFKGPTEFKKQANRFETKDLVVNVYPNNLCVSTFDKRQQKTLNTVCPNKMHQWWKELEIHGQYGSHAYGLGQYFRNPGQSDGDWVGDVWDPLPNTMGNSLRPFSKGANGYALFPILYVLDKEQNNYGLFLDNTYKQMWSFDKKPWTVGMFGEIKWFLFTGSDLGHLRQTYMDLTGKPPLAPREMFGLWTSKFGYRNWDEVHNVVTKHRTSGFPLDGVVLDLQWFGGRFYPKGSDVQSSQMGSLTFDEENFPLPEYVVPELEKQDGVKVMTIEEPYISKYLKEFGQLKARGFMAYNCFDERPTVLSHNPWWGIGGMIDYSNPMAGDYWHQLKRRPLIDMGITAHWTDLGEPEMYDERSCYYGLKELDRHMHTDIHNIFNLRWSQSIARGYETSREVKRPFIMSRSGRSGIQRYGTGMWSGDIAANMNALNAHFNAQMHMSLSGVDYYGSDIGGFHRSKGTLDGDAHALYTQWFANSTLIDFPIRPHAWSIGQNIKTSPTEMGDFESNLFHLRQRYQLFPYYYSLAYRSYLKGEAMIPPLVYYFQADEQVRKIGHQKMIGPYLMAGIVAKYGERYRSVYFPKGQWLNFHDNSFIESNGQWQNDLPVYREGRFTIPLYLRQGAIIPTLSNSEYMINIKGRLSNGELDGSDLSFIIFPSIHGTSFTLYEDDGETIHYKEGKYTHTKIEQVQYSDHVFVTIYPRVGEYDNMPVKRNYTIDLRHHFKTIEKVEIKEYPQSGSIRIRDIKLNAFSYLGKDSGYENKIFLGRLSPESRKEVKIYYK